MNHEAFNKDYLRPLRRQFNEWQPKQRVCANTAFQVTAKTGPICHRCNKDNYTCGLISPEPGFCHFHPATRHQS